MSVFFGRVAGDDIDDLLELREGWSARTMPLKGARVSVRLRIQNDRGLRPAKTSF